MKLFLSPHNDDETLFGAFTVQRERPLVVVVYDSHVQALRGHPVTASERRAETEAAMRILGAPVVFLGLSDADSDARASDLLKHFANPEAVWAPAVEDGGHPQHNHVGAVADRLWPDRVTHYLTYTIRGRSTSSRPVAIESGEWVRKKLHALTCYESQIDIAALGCREHFLRGLHEYYQ